MTQEAFPQRSTEPDDTGTFISMVGTGAATPTKLFGRGVTIGRTGVGVITLTWSSSPGRYLGVKGYCYEADAPAALKGWTMVPGAWNATTRTLTINTTNNADTLADLAAAQRLSITVAFKKTNA